MTIQTEMSQEGKTNSRILSKVEIRDNRTPEEIRKLQEIDGQSKNLDVVSEPLEGIIDLETFRDCQGYCYSEKSYADTLKIDIQIWKLRMLLAWAESRKPDFMSSQFLSKHAQYVQARRYWRLHQTLLQKIETGKVEFNGEFI